MKNILLAIVGLSPQVVTETLYALHQQGRRVDALEIITTRHGKEAINAFLLAPGDGQYHRYLADYGIDPAQIDFSFDHVHTVNDNNGIEINDITDEEDNESLLRYCLELTFRLTRDPETTVFFSLAGGRKTMSACLMLAAQFYARPQDRVYHVLVSPEFESNRDFFYPPRESRPIELRDRENQPYFKETRYARVNLVPIPFFSVRDQLAGDLLREPKDPATLMLNLIRDEPSVLTVDLVAGKLIFRKRELDMMPARLALYAFFALQKKGCTREVGSCRGCDDCYLDFSGIASRQGEITKIYRQVAGGRDTWEMSDTGILGLNAENFNSYKGKIRKELERGFGAYATPQLAIEAVGHRPDTRYGITLDREKIRIVL